MAEITQSHQQQEFSVLKIHRFSNRIADSIAQMHPAYSLVRRLVDINVPFYISCTTLIGEIFSPFL